MEFLSVNEGCIKGGTYRLQIMLSEKTDAIYPDIQAIFARNKGANTTDMAVSYLHKVGITDYMLEVKGTAVARGRRPNGKPWTTALTLPIRDKTVLKRFVPINNCAMATATCLLETPANVTAVAPNCALASALATDLLAMGPETALNYANANAIPASFITQTIHGFEERCTDMMTAILA